MQGPAERPNVRRGFVAIGFSTVLVSAVSVLAPNSSYAAALDNAVRSCRLISPHEARLACYDAMKLDESVSAAPVVAPSAEAQPAPVWAQAPVPQAASQPATTTIVVSAGSRGVISGDLSKVTVEIASVTIINDRMVHVVMTDGVNWDQTEDKRLHTWPKASDALLIRRTLLGGYRCGVEKRDSFSCMPDRKRR